MATLSPICQLNGIRPLAGMAAVVLAGDLRANLAFCETQRGELLGKFPPELRTGAEPRAQDATPVSAVSPLAMTATRDSDLRAHRLAGDSSGQR